MKVSDSWSDILFGLTRKRALGFSPDSLEESSFSRTLSSLFLIRTLNVLFGSSLREFGISFHNLTPILEKAFFGISSLEGFM